MRCLVLVEILNPNRTTAQASDIMAPRTPTCVLPDEHLGLALLRTCSAAIAAVSVLISVTSWHQAGHLDHTRAVSAPLAPATSRAAVPAPWPPLNAPPLTYIRPAVYLIDDGSQAPMVEGLMAAANAPAIMLPIESSDVTSLQEQLSAVATWQQRFGQPSVQIIDLRRP
jgi:hypothetical protein